MKKYPFVKQEQLKDCGATCLSMIIKYYQGYVPIDKLREMTKTTKKGVTAYHIIETLKTLGFEAQGIKTNKLDNVILPAIAFVTIDNSYNHYVVIYEVDYKKNLIVIADPATKIKKMEIADFLKIYNQILITFYPLKKIPLYNKPLTILEFTFNLLKQHKIIFLKIFLLSILITLLSVVGSFYLEFIINSINKINKSLLSYIFILFSSIFLIKTILDFIRNKLLIKINHEIELDLTNDTFSSIIKLPYRYFKNRTTGEVISRINDLSTLKEMISKVTLTLLIDLSLTIVSAIFLYHINSKLFIISLIILILYSLIVIVFQKKFEEQIDEIQEEKAVLNSYMTESISGFETIKGLAIEKNIIDKFKKNNVLLIKKILKFENLYNLEYFLKEIVSNIGQALIIFIGSILVLNNQITLGNLITFDLLLLYFLSPIRNIIDLNKDIKEASSALKRINELIIKEKKEKTYDKCIFKNIEIKNLNYSHNDFDNILNNINLKINKGDKIMMIGSSGSGKSTLLKILKGYYKTKNNHIFIDNKDINKYNQKNINDNITYISQNEILYSDTIYNNLKLDRNISKDNLNKTIDICYLNKIIDNNLGLNMLIEENGFNLSGGERQRIILARGLLNNFEILILDETLSQVDINLERKILKNILNEFNDKTIIFVSHRYNNIDLFDKVINLEQGKIKNIESKNIQHLPRKENYV